MKQELINNLPTLMKDVITLMKDGEGVSAEMVLPVALSVSNFAVQSIMDANPIQWTRSPCGQFYVVVAESGERKTATYILLCDGIIKWQEEQMFEAKKAKTEYLIEKKKYDKELMNRAKQDPDEYANEPPLVEPQIYSNWKHLFEKFTTNGLLKDLELVPHCFLVNTDAAEFFNSHAFQGKGTDTEIVSALSKLWSGEAITKSTGIEEKYIANRRASALFMIQAGQAKFLKDERFKDQGFTNRLLIAQPPRIQHKITSLWDEGNIEKKAKLKEAIDKFNDHIYKLLNKGADTKKMWQADVPHDELRSTDKNELKYLLRMEVNATDGARDVYNEMFQTFEKVKQDEFYKVEGFYEEYGAFLNRCFEHYCRMATTLALFEENDTITKENAECAKEIILWFIEQRHNLELDIARDKSEIVQCAESLLKLMKKWYKTTPKLFIKDIVAYDGMSRTFLNNNGPATYKIMETPDRDRVLEEMASREWIEFETIYDALGKERFEVVKLVNTIAQQAVAV